jgi:RimJ/RimL family protein N-acetyltransferase
MPPILVGKGITLRAPTEDDLPFLLAFANDPDLRGYLRFATPMTENHERAWLHGLDDARERVWLMTEPGTGRAFGSIGLSEWDRVARHAEVGLGILAPDDRARGLGGEALALVLRHAFHDMNLQRVWLHVVEDNPARRLYARMGFREEGALRRHHRKRGAWRDSIVMGLLREEWRD